MDCDQAVPDHFEEANNIFIADEKVHAEQGLDYWKWRTQFYIQKLTTERHEHKEHVVRLEQSVSEAENWGNTLCLDAHELRKKVANLQRQIRQLKKQGA